MIITHSRRRLVGVGALSTVLALAGTATAAAHVRVHTDSESAGSFSALTFRVPNESDTAGTVKVVVTLPSDQPFLYVSTKPLPGWSATTTEQRLPKPVESYGTTLTKAVRTVTWMADSGTQIRPGEYQEFSISVGPLPSSGTVVLPTDQTYSDGTVAKWSQVQAAGAAEPEYPAPQFTVLPQEAVPQTSSGGGTATATAAIDPVGRLLSGLALVVGVAAILVTVLTRRGARA